MDFEFDLKQNVIVVNGYGSAMNGRGGEAKITDRRIRTTDGMPIYKVVYKNRHLHPTWLLAVNLQAKA